MRCFVSFAAVLLSSSLMWADTPVFSFVLDGKPSSQCLGDARVATEGHRETAVYPCEGTGIEVRCERTRYADFPAEEWVLYFKNAGTENAPILEAVYPLDQAFASATPGVFTLHHALGSHERPDDFAPRETALSEEARFAPNFGRSSDGVMPFFNLAKPGGGGVFIAIGWTGQWAASFAPEGDAAVRVRAGMELTHLSLRPGEEIRTPAILTMSWEGNDRYAAHNLWRRFLLEHYTPKDAHYPVAASPHGKIPFTGTTEANMLECIQNIAGKLPIDTFWIDAGWHGDDPNWAINPGTWTPNAQRFPNGLKPVADAAHANGMTFLLWCEPERVMRGSWLQQTHPEWLLSPGKMSLELLYQKKDGFYLLDLGNPEALAWTIDTFSSLIRDTGIDIYRQDFNMYPLSYWQHDEPEDRQGMREIRHITGLYTFWDTLKKTFPGLTFDNCASGGRRIDFEIMRRALTLFRSDFCWDPASEQAMNYGISLWTPVTGLGAVSAEPYPFRSGIGAFISLALNYYDAPEMWPQAKKMLDQYLSIRQLFSKDFYPLSPYSLEKNQWIGWQYHDPVSGEGLVQVFRREECAETHFTAVLHGLDAAAVYAVADMDAEGSTEVSGAVLMNEGYGIDAPVAPAAAMVHYWKLR